MKKIYVILTFHAHEPLWDLPGQLQKSIPDEKIQTALAPENYLKKRAREGRDIYQNLFDFAKRLKIKVSLDITNELLYQIKKIIPDTFEDLKKAYQENLIYPIYTTAHHTHICFLHPEELSEEIKLNQEFLHNIMGVPVPEYKGFFFTENSVDSRFIETLQENKIDYIVFPHLNSKKSDFEVSDQDYDYTYKPFKVDSKLVALPRHFPVSQEIWRPLTRWYPEKAKYQGYMMGKYFVLDSEYRDKKYEKCPITKEEAIEEYAQVLRQALDEAPSDGLIFYIQDLELMDFGDWALEILESAWQKVLSETKHEVCFASPDEFIEENKSNFNLLPEVKFNKISWIPEIRLVLRTDGHYPPLGAGEYKGVDADETIFKKYPFIFWEAGKLLTPVFDWLLKEYGFNLAITTTAESLVDTDYYLPDFPDKVRLPLHLRLMKRACNWGWRPDEGRHKRPFLHGFMIADCLLRNEVEPRPEVQPPSEVGHLSKLPELFIDTRVEFLAEGLRQQEKDFNFSSEAGLQHIEEAKTYRDRAVIASKKLSEYYKELKEKSVSYLMTKFLSQVSEYCRCMFLSLDYLQHAWGKTKDVDEMVDFMYKYLYEIYPPKLPQVLNKTNVPAK